MKFAHLLFVLMLGCCSAQAQYPSVTIPGSQIRKITSAIVNNQEYELQVLLPGGYATSNKKYPVVFVMDSQWDFPLVKSIYGQQYFDGFIPEVIIVGITWGGTNPNADSLRARDYTPTREARLIQSGGADQFLSFMKNELFPFLDASYRVDNNQRILMGCSLGGLFTLYSMFTHTEMFNGYVAASPAVAWDKAVLYKYEKEFSEKKLVNPVRLYLTVGDVERENETFKKMSSFIESRQYSNVAIRSKVLENTGHSGTKSETYSRGLQYIFERPDLQLSGPQLQQYAGYYKYADGTSISIKVKNGRLAIESAGENIDGLKYSGNNLFYSDASFLNLVFSKDLKTLQFNLFGSSKTFWRQ